MSCEKISWLSVSTITALSKRHLSRINWTSWYSANKDSVVQRSKLKKFASLVIKSMEQVSSVRDSFNHVRCPFVRKISFAWIVPRTFIIRRKKLGRSRKRKDDRVSCRISLIVVVNEFVDSFSVSSSTAILPARLYISNISGFNICSAYRN